MYVNIIESGQPSLSADIAVSISQSSDLEISRLIPNPKSFGSSKENVIFGGSDSSLNGTGGVDVFVITSAGATISGFEVGKDKVGIVSNDRALTFLDIINPYIPGGITDTDKGAVVSLPNGSTRNSFVTLSGVSASALANSPESFSIFLPGNVVIDWNEVMFDAGRNTPVPGSRSARYYALLHTAIADAVQGIQKTAGRSTYLESIGQRLPTVTSGASAEAAAASAANTILKALFTDPDNPVAVSNISPFPGETTNTGKFLSRVFDAAFSTSLTEIDGSTDGVNAGIEFGRSIAQRLLDLRANDGAFRNADGTRVDLSGFAAEYQNGIENNYHLNERSFQDGSSTLLNNGTVGRLQDGTNLIGTAVPIEAIDQNGNKTITSIAKTTPGAWRRGEDTLNTSGQFSGLASPDVAKLNQAWVLPSPDFFSNNILPPPALDSDCYRDNVAEVKAEGSILDLPGNGTVSILNRSITENGVTRFLGTGAGGNAVNDTNPADVNFGLGSEGKEFSRTGSDKLGLTSADRTIIAHVWANAEGTYQPNYAWQKVAQQLAINNKSSLEDTAYIFGAMNMALADGYANVWDIQWDRDYFWRPVSSIRNADQLKSTFDLDDNTWTARENTPQHPDPPSAAAAVAGVASNILSSFYGDNQTFTVSADPNPSSARLQNALRSLNGNDLVHGTPLEEVSRTYTSLSQAANEARTSRIYAGAHHRFATKDGINLGKKVAQYFLRHNPFLVQRRNIMSESVKTPESE
ncbi:vanadium-dependent haloperoxidase [Chroococcidiopsis sp. CCMEE 29]|uniref:vanadium-dependent haloperoxidase n=1 Tax=Chroococcidiopsis sp. CCMEE 29 TaxID=155894 RepID=UPI002022811D|nr:vanadium-dependent haloperoxidase [Chroococcidiopsis sp. CCMEE 29]